MKDFYKNDDKDRFEMTESGETVFANYRLDGQELYIDYVFAPETLRGSGAAGRLMQKIVEYADQNNLSITPVCGYAKHWLKRNS